MVRRMPAALLAAAGAFGCSLAWAAPVLSAPGIQIGTGGADVSLALKVLLGLTVLSLAPAILVSMTAFIRIVIVLSMLRHALGMQETPPNTVIVSLALFLTLFTMAPVLHKVNEEALQPYLAGSLAPDRAAFQIGFVIFLPFLLVDLIVSSALMALGMMMVPPASISLPLKILLFVLMDGWSLVVRALLGTFA
jgi:flagellar biosynthetic protein FliP